MNAKTIAVEEVAARILVVRGKKVMMDSDLATMYGVSTTRLNQQVRRNIRRFPADFMFELSSSEHRSLMLQIATSNVGRGGRRKSPLVFTQEGVAMLSSVLKSGRAIQANVAIMRAFVRQREMLAVQREMSRRLDDLESQVAGHGREIESLIREIRGYIETPEPSKRIGFSTDRQGSKVSVRRPGRPRPRRDGRPGPWSPGRWRGLP